jgi:MFS family permease
MGRRPGRRRSERELPAEELTIRRSVNRTPVRTEAAGFGMMLTIHNAFINPLLIERGAGPLALGIFNSGANLFLYSAGFLGPRAAYRLGSLGKTVLSILIAARLVLIALTAFLWLVPDGAVIPVLIVALVWTAGEGLILPLWTAFIAGLVPPSLRGRWLAMRGAASAGAAAAIMIALLIMMQFTSRTAAIPFAYTISTLAGVISLWQIKTLIGLNPQDAPPKPKSLRSIPPGRERRRFLGGVFSFWFGAGIIWPILPAYIIKELGAPTAFFAILSATAAITAATVQRHWGRHGDLHGPRARVFYSGVGTSLVPFLWTLTPFYYIGILFEMIGSSCWPGHSLGLTMRALELAETEEERPAMIAWTSLAQGAGASISPLIASIFVNWTGAIPLLLASAALRWVGTMIIAEPEREGWFRGRSPVRWRRRNRATATQSAA